MKWAITSFALCVGFSLPVLAQRAVVEVRPSSDSDAASSWRGAVETALVATGREVSADPKVFALRSMPSGSVSPSRIRVFAEVERDLFEARRMAVDLREGAALALLARARGKVEGHVDVPGATAWLAEVETAIGIVAAQAGRDALAQQSIVRAVSLDPERGIRAGEAPPALVEQARRASVAVLSAPIGSFEVRCDARGSVVYLDGERVGSAPQIVRARSGRHVVRVEAPGYRSYGRVVDLLEGARPTFEVALAPGRPMVAAERLRGSLRRLEFSAIQTLLPRVGIDEAWSVWIGGRSDRALIARCAVAGCNVPQRLDDSGAVDIGIHESAPVVRDLRSALAEGLRWLGAPDMESSEPTPFYLNGWLWAGVGAISAAIIASVLIASALGGEREEVPQIVVDPRLGE